MDIFDKYDDLRREREDLDRVIEKLCRAYVFDSNFDKATYRLESFDGWEIPNPCARIVNIRYTICYIKDDTIRGHKVGEIEQILKSVHEKDLVIKTEY